MALTHSEIIDMLGGNSDLAERLGVHDTSISRWRRDGIPPAHWVNIARLAKRRRLRITVEQIAAAAPRLRSKLTEVS